MELAWLSVVSHLSTLKGEDFLHIAPLVLDTIYQTATYSPPALDASPIISSPYSSPPPSSSDAISFSSSYWRSPFALAMIGPLEEAARRHFSSSSYGDLARYFWIRASILYAPLDLIQLLTEVMELQDADLFWKLGPTLLDSFLS